MGHEGNAPNIAAACLRGSSRQICPTAEPRSITAAGPRPIRRGELEVASHSGTASYLSRGTRSRLVPSIRIDRVGPARLGACRWMTRPKLRLWNAIVRNGGEESECGWCRDKWGLSWQITPRALVDAISDPDPAAAKRAFEAMMTMRKIDIAAIEAARQG